MVTRREFAKLACVTLPAARAWARIDSKVDGVQLGVQSYSFRDLSFHDALKAMVTDGLGLCELFAPHIEGGKLDQKPERMDREALRQWRLKTPLSYFEDVKKQFQNAGVELRAYNYSFASDFSDGEIDRGFEFAKALGVKFLTASTTLPVAKRVAPFANKHKVIVAMHGYSDLKDPDQFATPQSFAKAQAMSQYFKTNLDIGHFTAANFDAVDYIQKHHADILLLHMKDRKKNEGPNTVWGEGDTPIKQVLLLLKEKKYPIPACIEYEYEGSGSSPDEVKKCFEYEKQILNG